MVFEIFTALVAFLAASYAAIAKYLQNRLVDRKEVEEIQAESKRLNEELKKAQENKNQKKMDEIMKKQMDFLPKMNKMMMAQFKPMFFILAIFFAFTWVVGHIDPSVKDDIEINMSDDGKGCDAIADDKIFSTCYILENTNYGKWGFAAKAFVENSELGYNSTYFNYNSNTTDTFTEAPKGQPLIVSTDKGAYLPGETVKLYAQNDNATNVKAILNNGTSFYVDLPFSIPIINVQRIQQPYWWFIFISLISNLSISLVMGRLQKKTAGAEKK